MGYGVVAICCQLTGFRANEAAGGWEEAELAGRGGGVVLKRPRRLTKLGSKKPPRRKPVPVPLKIGVVQSTPERERGGRYDGMGVM